MYQGNDDDIFRRHRLDLVDNVVCTERLLSYLPRGSLNLDEREMVLCAEGNRNKVRRLIDALSRKSIKDTFIHFLSALKKDGQNRVVRLVSKSNTGTRTTTTATTSIHPCSKVVSDSFFFSLFSGLVIE